MSKSKSSKKIIKEETDGHMAAGHMSKELGKLEGHALKRKHHSGF